MDRKIRLFGLIGVCLIAGVLLNEYILYKSNIESPSCCGYVSPEWYKRPVTHLLVNWTDPQWELNATETEQWLVSDGLVNGKVEFWTVWETIDIEPTTFNQPRKQG
ncbi:TPA: hypothetical protein NKR24_004343 [Vibrio parahaemolyticus]|nr:hypothetical protein [Vibrio parahaemolyticus]